MSAMLTDSLPRKPNLKFFTNSDRLRTIPLLEDGRFVKITGAIEAAMKTEDTPSPASWRIDWPA
jgi:hypothetical protein